MIFLAILMRLAVADDSSLLSLKYGLDSNSQWKFQTKAILIDYQSPLVGLMYYRLGAGIYSDLAYEDGHVITGMGSGQFGFAVNPDIFSAGIFFGPMLITNTDNRLGTLLEFRHSVYGALRDKSGMSIGIEYSHISNASLGGVNRGRDLFLLQLMLPVKLW